MKKSKHLQRIAKFTVLVLGLSLVLAGCAKPAGDTDKVSLRIGYFANITHAQALVLKDQQKIQETLGDDVDVTWVTFNAGPAEIEAMKAGEIDMGYIGPIPAINAYNTMNGEIGIVANASDGGAILVTRPDLVLGSVKELDGKKVAIPQIGNTQHASLLNLLSENGLKPTTEGGTVDVVAVENAEVRLTMDNGDIDAALVPEPWGTILEKDIGANVLLDYKDIWMGGDYTVALVICHNDFKEKHPDIVKKFLAAHKEITRFINGNPDEAKAAINREYEAAGKEAIAADILDSAFTRLMVTEVLNQDSLFAFAEINGRELDKGAPVPGQDLVDISLME